MKTRKTKINCVKISGFLIYFSRHNISKVAIPVFLGLRNRYGFRKGVVMTDAAQFIDALGGTNKVANALALAPTTVSSWKSSGSIPEWRMDKLKRLLSLSMNRHA